MLIRYGSVVFSPDQVRQIVVGTGTVTNGVPQASVALHIDLGESSNTVTSVKFSGPSANDQAAAYRDTLISFFWDVKSLPTPPTE